MRYITSLMNPKTKRRSGIPINKVKFLVAHDTGNPNSTARNNVDYYKRTENEVYGSAHIFVDDKEAIMCIPAFENAEKAWHVRYSVNEDNAMFGNDSNDSAIGVELCYFPDDYKRSLQAYKNYVDIFVDLIIFHNILPIEITGHEFLDPSRRTDPSNALKHINKTVSNLFEDIEKGYIKRMTPYEDYSDILKMCLDNPTKMIKAIDSMTEMSVLSSNLGDIEQLKYLQDVIIKVFEYGREYENELTMKER